ncbi:cell wall protein AWA1-like isoform X2 [Amphibalanus amphitrite]|uniref:cell wall protein AWA1-like isoform X2 n=1 Tax=Amphibalanus amphitrite TaxID=1232801 RepID=UPI001C90D9C9|nr:cell wall protein AWA1-like isoform X2 [Amphibalanus amphitrite]
MADGDKQSWPVQWLGLRSADSIDFKRLGGDQRVPVRTAPPPPPPGAPSPAPTGVEVGFVRSSSQPANNRRPVLELVDRNGNDPDPPPSRPARSSGRHGRSRKSDKEARRAEQQSRKRAPPPRPPPPNLQAALGSPPSYEETLKMDSAAADRLAEPISESGNPFLMGVRRTSDRPAASPLHRDHSSSALTSTGSSGNLAGGSVSRNSSTRSAADSSRSAADDSSRRSSATPSLDSASAAVISDTQSEPAGADPWSRRSSGVASGDPQGSGAERSSFDSGQEGSSSATQSSRSSYNPFHPLPADGQAGQSASASTSSVTAPPRHSRAGPAGSGLTPSAGWAGSNSSSAHRDSGWAGRVSRTASQLNHSPFTRDGPGRTAHHGAPFGRETVWAGRITRADSTSDKMVTRGSSGSLSKDGESASGTSPSEPSGSVSQAVEAPVSRSDTIRSAGAATSTSASTSASLSTSPTSSLPASPVRSHPASPAASPAASPPGSPPASPPTSPRTARPTRSATSSPPVPSSTPLVLTVYTTVSHESADDSAGQSAGESASLTVGESVSHAAGEALSRTTVESLSSPVGSAHASSVSPAGARSGEGSARSSVTSPDRAGVTSSTTSPALHNGDSLAENGDLVDTGDRCDRSEGVVLRRNRGGASAGAARVTSSTVDAHRGSGDAPPLNWGLPVEPVTSTTPQAVALYDFHSSAPGDLPFKAGDSLVLVRRVTADWLLCQVGDRHGLVPAHHVRETVPLPTSLSVSLPGAASPLPPAPGLSSSQSTSPESQPTSPDGPPAQGQRAMALYDFVPQEKYDLGFKAGDMLLVVGKLNNDWGYGSRRGVSGQFPLSYVDVEVENVPTI